MVHERVQNKRSLFKLIEKRQSNYEVAESRINQIQENGEKDYALLADWCSFMLKLNEKFYQYRQYC